MDSWIFEFFVLSDMTQQKLANDLKLVIFCYDNCLVLKWRKQTVVNKWITALLLVSLFVPSKFSLKLWFRTRIVNLYVEQWSKVSCFPWHFNSFSGIYFDALKCHQVIFFFATFFFFFNQDFLLDNFWSNLHSRIIMHSILCWIVW